MVEPDDADWRRLAEFLAERLWRTTPETVSLRHGVDGTWNEWGRLLAALETRGVGEESYLYWGYPSFCGDQYVAEMAQLMRVERRAMELRRGTDRDWDVAFAPLRFAGILYYRFQSWPALIVPARMDWAIESPYSANVSYVY